MIGHKRSLAAAREKQLAALRAEAGQPERLTLPFACATTDQDFVVTFVRPPGSRVFTCGSVELNRDRLGRLKRLQARFGRADTASISANEIDFGGVVCGGCGARRQWILCDRCAAHVCDSRSTHHVFNCRTGCGASGGIEPLAKVDGSRGGAIAGRPAIGHGGAKALPGRGRS